MVVRVDAICGCEGETGLNNLSHNLIAFLWNSFVRLVIFEARGAESTKSNMKFPAELASCLFKRKFAMKIIKFEPKPVSQLEKS